MNRSIVIAALALGVAVATTPASAVVYCKSVGVPKGCVVRPATTASPVVYCKSAGVPKGCVARPVAPGAAAVAAPKPGNLNGGVNRVGRVR